MTQRITRSDLEAVVRRINKVMGTPEKPWQPKRDDTPGMTANIGNYHISGAYGGVSLHRMMNEGAGTLEILDRLPNSHYGNPRYLLRIDGRTCRTAPDSATGYSVPNFDGKQVTALIGTHYGKATLDHAELVAQ